MAFADLDGIDSRPSAGIGASGETLYKLGLCFSTGQGAPLDFIEAHKWFNLAAMRGHQAARAYRRELADQMSPDEVTNALLAAREWLSQSQAEAA
jgi:uncharacterized protein